MKRGEKLFKRITRYFRTKKELENTPNRFVEEDENTLDYRDTADKIEELHTKNFQNYALILFCQKKFKEALEVINQCINKVDHRNFDTLKIKVDILMAKGEYVSAKYVVT